MTMSPHINNSSSQVNEDNPTLPIISLILGILSLCSLITCCFCLPVSIIISIPGIICGIISLNMMKTGKITNKYRGLALGGLICSIVGLIIASLVFILSAVVNIITLPSSEQLIQKI